MPKRVLGQDFVGYLILTKNLRYAKRFIIDIVEKETKAMKHAAAKSTVDMLHEIETIEKKRLWI